MARQRTQNKSLTLCREAETDPNRRSAYLAELTIAKAAIVAAYAQVMKSSLPIKTYVGRDQDRSIRNKLAAIATLTAEDVTNIAIAPSAPSASMRAVPIDGAAA